MTRAGSLQVWALLIGGALVTWIVTYHRMHGMDEGPIWAGSRGSSGSGSR